MLTFTFLPFICHGLLNCLEQIGAYTMSATNHASHKVYNDGHSNENVKR